MRTIVPLLGLAAMCFSPCATQAQLAPVEVLPDARPAEAIALTHARALALAVRHSFVIAAARQQVEAAVGGVQQAVLLRNPSFTALVEDTRRETRMSTATIDVPLELGGKRDARTVAALRAREVAEAELANATAEVEASVTAAFFDVVIAQERLSLANDSAALATRGAEAIAKRVSAGKTSPVDETRARVDEVNAALETSEAETALLSARQLLASSWNEADLAVASVDGDLESLTPSRVIDAAAIDGAPVVHAMRREVAFRRALIDVEKSKRLPDLTVTLGAKRDPEVRRTQAVIGLSIPLPIFDRNQGNVYEAAKRADKAEDDLRATRVRVRGELQRAANDLALATRTVDTLKTRVLPAAQDAVAATKRGFEAGKFAFVDVLDAQRTLLAARTRYLGALATAMRATATIDRLYGHRTR